MVERRQIETDEAIAHERAAVEDVRSRLSAAITSRDDDISKLIDECKKLQVCAGLHLDCDLLLDIVLMVVSL